MSQPRSPVARTLLGSLPSDDRERLLAGGERIELALADVVYRALERPRQVFFPIDAVIAVIASDGDGAQLGIALIGDDGMLGVSLVLGGPAVPCRAIVQGTGLAWRMDVGHFRRELARSAALQRRLDAYLFVLVSQFAQAVACTRFHFVQARLARWLLMTRDRTHSDRFHITHEFLADMLGVRRAGITRAARDLQERGLIEYSRGHVTIVDGRGLEGAACSCYAADRESAGRPLPRRTPV